MPQVHPASRTCGTGGSAFAFHATFIFVLAVHTKNLILEDNLAVGVDRM
jgi:hypothetical protein